MKLFITEQLADPRLNVFYVLSVPSMYNVIYYKT